MSEDLAEGQLSEIMPDRPIRSYPAAVSTEAHARAWARLPAPEGAVVVADYQISARNRAGFEWTIHPGRSLGFSLVVRPALPATREGWLYAIASLGVAEALSDEATIEWPDEVQLHGRKLGSVSVHAEIAATSIDWAVVNVVIDEADPPRGPLLARVVASIEDVHRRSMPDVVRGHRERLRTMGRDVVARLIPLGPAGRTVEGRAVSTGLDGSLVLQRPDGRQTAVRPMDVGILEVDGRVPQDESAT